MSTPHVLLVEDNELVTGALSILLETTGARVSVAASIAEALGVAQADPPKLVLLDLTLPDGDGLTVIEPLRAARLFLCLPPRDLVDRDTEKHMRHLI